MTGDVDEGAELLDARLFERRVADAHDGPAWLRRRNE
jgi:hypothetical protein